MGHVIDLACNCWIEMSAGRPVITLLGEHVSVLPGQTRGLKQIALNSYVKKFRFSTLLGLAHGNLFSSHHAAGLACRIVQIAGDYRLRRTDDHTGRFQLVLHAVSTEITFGGSVVVGINIEGVVGAGLHASFTADASLVVKVYDSIRTAVESV